MRELLAHDRICDDRVDLYADDNLAARGQRAHRPVLRLTVPVSESKASGVIRSTTWSFTVADNTTVGTIARVPLSGDPPKVI